MMWNIQSDLIDFILKFRNNMWYIILWNTSDLYVQNLLTILENR